MGVGCLYGFGRWMRWMPLAKALGGVRGRGEATVRWEHGLPWSRRQRGPLDLERSTGEV